MDYLLAPSSVNTAAARGAGGTYLTVVAGRPVRTVVVSALLWVVVVALVTAVLEIEYLSEYFVSGTYDRFYIYLFCLLIQ